MRNLNGCFTVPRCQKSWTMGAAIALGLLGSASVVAQGGTNATPTIVLGASAPFKPVLIKPNLIRPAPIRSVPIKPTVQLPPAHRPLTIPHCPDLTIQNLHITGVWREARSSNRYGIRVNGYIKNIGRGNYTTRLNQQQISFSGAGLSTSGSRFGNIAAGQRVEKGAVFRNLAGGPGAVFTTAIRAELIFDPDIRWDNNPANDECNKRNNTAVLRGSVIARAITSYQRSHPRGARRLLIKKKKYSNSGSRRPH